LIESELARTFDWLAKERFLEGLSRREFSLKMAAFFSEINRIHPFREGNGRAQRQFVRQLSDSLRFKLHFEVVSKERLVRASSLSANGHLAMMERLMDEITDTERIQPLIKVIARLKEQGFNWNDQYLATTSPGQNYTGTFADTDSLNFFFRDRENRILVGKLKDLESHPKSGEQVRFTAS